MSAAPADHSRSFRLLLLISLIPLLGLWSPPARADAGPVCGPGRLAFEGGPDLTFTTPAAAFNCLCGVCNPESAAYDVPAGRLSVGDSCMCVGAIAHVTVTEDFTLTGPADGTAVTFDARLHLVGALNFWFPAAHTSAWITAGLLADGSGDSVVVIDGSRSGILPVDRWFSIPLVRPAGQPFRIVYNLMCGGSDFATVAHGDARFDFIGLPPGVGIHSCRGYTQDSPTPARPASWGAIKAGYR